jgi:hypothetical protein
MFLFKKHLDRRTFLRSMGATVALPLLDAMLPARALLASVRPAQRLAFVYFPHGAVMDEWIDDGRRQTADGIRIRQAADHQTAGGPNSRRLGRILEPLLPFANRLTIVSGVENRHAYGPVHAITPGTWLSGTSPRDTGDPSTRLGAGAALGATADQLAADYLGRGTLLPSISLAAEQPRRIDAGIWEGQFDASYGTTLSIRRGRVPVPMEFSPRIAFDTLFGCDSASEPQDSSVLDRIAADTASLRTRLGAADRALLGDYLEAVRDVERRVERVEGQLNLDVEKTFIERLTLVFDLTALAFRADITRVASLMMAAEASSMAYGHMGIPESFHLLSHHQNDPEKLDQLVRIQTFHTRMFASFVRTLAELPDGDASILDRSLILFGSNMCDSHAHDHFPLPLAMIGGGCGTLLGFRHARLPDRTPMSNLLLTVLRRAGVPVQSIGDSSEDCGISLD